jgi:hypothetical protein
MSLLNFFEVSQVLPGLAPVSQSHSLLCLLCNALHCFISFFCFSVVSGMKVNLAFKTGCTWKIELIFLLGIVHIFPRLVKCDWMVEIMKFTLLNSGFCHIFLMSLNFSLVYSHPQPRYTLILFTEVQKVPPGRRPQDACSSLTCFLCVRDHIPPRSACKGCFMYCIHSSSS